jgi:transcriptional regulator with XRE-family HTH domain
MKLLLEQRELGEKLGITQAMVSRIELGHLSVTEKITVTGLKAILGPHYSFVAFGTNPERYHQQTILKVYWDTRLRVRRKNKSAYSRIRL